MAIQRINLGTAPSGTGGDTNRSAFTKIDGNFADTTHAASRLVGTAAGNVMEVGAFGWGSGNSGLTFSVTTDSELVSSLQEKTRLFKNNVANPATVQYGAGLYVKPSDTGFGITVGARGGGVRIFAHDAANMATPVIYNLWTSRNTSVDPNGFIKNASPIVSLYADKIELNDEAKLQDITFEKLGVGDYLIKGSTGFAQEGWYIETPKDANGNVLVAVAYEQLANGDISVKTYDYMLNKKGRIVPDLETPLDIPETRWVDLRLQPLPQPEIEPSDIQEKAVPDA